MDGRAHIGLLFLGWVLMSASRDGAWQPVDDFPGSLTCERVRSIRVADEVRREIGSALADQPADNPMRRQAYEHAERRVRERYRCEWRGS